MTRLTKTYLTIALACFASGMLFMTGAINVVDTPWLYVALPAGAIFFGLFLIWHMLEKEVASFDAERGEHGPVSTPERREGAACGCGCQTARQN